MKTRGLLGFMPVFLTALMAGGAGAKLSGKEAVNLHSHGTFHRRGKLKGWMKENRRSTFNKNR